MPPLLADFIHAGACIPICEKFLTRPDSLLKMLYLAMMDITKKWTGRRQDWSLIHAQMAIYFAERMPE